MERVAEGVYRLGTRWINFYLVEDGDALTLVDTGVPGYQDQLGPALAELGRNPSDVKAIVLTHTHADHIGGADVFVALTGAPVFVPAGEAAIATGEAKGANPKGVLSGMWHASMLSFIRHLIANKGFARVTVPTVTPFGEDDVLDVPGKLRVVYTPGHSAAHSSLLLEDRDVLIAGDALATLAVNTGKTGPMVHPFNADRERAIRSLDVLQRVEARYLLPGHGDPWSGGVAEAVALARTRL
jgi:glyoxylase-like metal-dependent hydrolase (beta-lactamase superfamily II)